MASLGRIRRLGAIVLMVLCLAVPASSQSRPSTRKPLPPPPIVKGPLPLFPIQTLWTISLNNLLTTAPAFDGRHAYFPIEENRVVAYDLQTGAQLWMVSIATSTRLVAGGDLLFVVEQHAISALRAEDGSLAWQLPWVDRLAVPLVWDNGWLLVASIDGTVRAMRASDGYIVWRRDIGSPAHASLALAADRVYVPTENGRVVSLRIDNGATIWDHRLGGAPSDVLATDDRIYVGSRDNFFYSLAADDGRTLWAMRSGGDVIGLPVVDESHVYFVSLDNLLRGLSRHSGNQRWKRPLLIRPTSGPVGAGDTVIVTGLGPSLPVFSRETGVMLGDVAGGEEVAAPPHVITLPGVAGPTIIVVTRNIAKGATVTAWARTLEPKMLTAVLALPQPVAVVRPPAEPTVRETVTPLPRIVRVPLPEGSSESPAGVTADTPPAAPSPTPPAP